MRRKPAAKAKKKRAAREPAEAEPYVEEAQTLGQEFVAIAAERLDEHELDFTIDSIRALDRACRFCREKFDDGLILRAGFYFGEMLRRAFKGKFEWDEKSDALGVRFEKLVVFPIEKVRKVVAGKEPNSLQDFMLILARRIADQRGVGSGIAGAGGGPA